MHSLVKHCSIISMLPCCVALIWQSNVLFWLFSVADESGGAGFFQMGTGCRGLGLGLGVVLPLGPAVSEALVSINCKWTCDVWPAARLDTWFFVVSWAITHFNQVFLVVTGDMLKKSFWDIDLWGGHWIKWRSFLNWALTSISLSTCTYANGAVYLEIWKEHFRLHCKWIFIPQLLEWLEALQQTIPSSLWGGEFFNERLLCFL